MARKELKPELQGMREALSSHRSEIAALKREVKALTAQLKSVQRAIKPPEKPVESTDAPARKGGRKWVFKPEAMAAKRAEFGLSQKEMAKLLQASTFSASNWELGKIKPRAAQLERIHEVLQMGKRKAAAALAEAA